MSSATTSGSGCSASGTGPPTMPLPVLEWTVSRNPLIPHIPTPRQIRFLELECLDALYGGAAGGGKSDALLMAGLQFAAVPGYAALLLRRTFADLKLPGALMDRADSWLRGKARWNAQEHRWRFPAGSTLQFGYCDNERDVYRYQSSEFQFVGLDEATQFTDFQVKYLFSRLRRRRSIPVPLRYRLGSNPGGVGHEFVKRRYVNPGDPARVFVPAKLQDNPYLDQEQYLRSLAELDPMTRAQLLAGDWDAVAGGRYLKEWFLHRYTQRGDYLVLRRPGVAGEETLHWPACRRFLTVDPAASEKTTADHTVVAVWLVTPRKELLLLDLDRFQAEPPRIVPRIEAMWGKWGRPDGVWVESVAANNAVYKFARETVMPARALSPLGTDKLVRATTALNYAATGRFWLPAPGVRAGMPLDDVEGELYRFTGDNKKDANDDVVDCFSYAAKVLAAGGVPGAAKGAAPVWMGQD